MVFVLGFSSCRLGVAGGCETLLLILMLFVMCVVGGCGFVVCELESGREQE